MSKARSRALLVLGFALALSVVHSPLAHAAPPAPDALARLDRRLAHSPKVRILTLAGIVEARAVRADSAGLVYGGIVSSTRRDRLPVPGTLAWDAVLGVDAIGNKAGHGAIGGGLALGAVGLLIGFAGGVASPMGEVGLWSFEGAAIGVGGGALLGAAIGATRPAWVRVYPSGSSSGAALPSVATASDSSARPVVKVLAIAPLANFSKRTTAEPAAQGIREGIVRQLALRSGTHTVTVQSIAETDRRLHEASTSTSAAARMSPRELCTLLGADAVLMGVVTRYRQRGTVGMVTLFLLLDVGAKGREAEVELAIYEGASGNAVWRQTVRRHSSIVSSPEALGNAVGAAVAEKFPYRRAAARR
jgi:TolB-like protein